MKIISVVGFKGIGKTRLVEQLVSEISGRGRVGTVKHLPGHVAEVGDTGRHLEAGASVTVGVNGGLRKLTREASLEVALDELADSGADYAIVEGFKHSHLPKVVLGHVEVDNVVARYASLEEADLEEIISILEVQPEYHTLKSLILQVKRNPEIRRAGAIVSFTGIVREVTGDTVTRTLEFEKYAGVAEERMEEICSDLRRREGIVDVLMYHRVGRINAGEDIVYIVVAGSHRQQVFPVLSEAIELLKESVPIWKKELTEEGEWWV